MLSLGDRSEKPIGLLVRSHSVSTIYLIGLHDCGRAGGEGIDQEHNVADRLRCSAWSMAL